MEEPTRDVRLGEVQVGLFKTLELTKLEFAIIIVELVKDCKTLNNEKCDWLHQADKLTLTQVGP